MKILLTGVTRLHTNETTSMNTQYQSTPEAVVQALRAAGHEVDFRSVRPGETLSYDAMIIGLSPIDAGPAKYSYGMLWALAHNTPKCFLFDDWKRGGSDLPFRGNETTLFRPYLGRPHAEEARRVWPILWAVVQHFHLPRTRHTERWNVPAIGTFFDWGDLELFKRGNAIGELRGFMPSPFIPDYELSNQSDRERMWVLAALADHRKWVDSLGLRWPVDGYGGWAKRRLQEEEIVRRYGSRWGVLCPRYPHAGSGWWRCRYDYSARAGAVLLASPDEVAPLGPAYTRVGESPRRAEGLDDDALRQLADDQARTLQPHLWSKDRLVTWMDDWVRELVNRGRSDTPIDPATLRDARFEPQAEVEDIWADIFDE